MMTDDSLPKVVLYAFRYVDPVSGKWKRARYRASLEEIAQRHAQWEVEGEPEIRQPVAGYFTPWR